MNFNTVSPVRFSAQGQVRRTSSPAPSLQKAAAPKDSVHFGNGLHTYRLVPNNQIDIIDNHHERMRYQVGALLGSQGTQNRYRLLVQGIEMGTITGMIGSSYSSYSLDDDNGGESLTFNLIHAQLAN